MKNGSDCKSYYYIDFFFKHIQNHREQNVQNHRTEREREKKNEDENINFKPVKVLERARMDGWR